MGKKRAVGARDIFPDGRIDGEYPQDSDQWSHSRWAWEFLRRNREYQQACDELLATPRKKRDALEEKIASRFFIRRFKDFREEYGEHNPLAPLFVRVRGLGMRPGFETKKLKVTLQQEQLLVVFDVRQMRFSGRALNAQLAEAKRKLTVLLNAYNATPGLPQPKNPDKSRHSRGRGQVSTWLKWLRLLDAKLHGVDNSDAYRAIYPGKSVGKGGVELQIAYSDEWKSAFAYSSERYLHLGLRDMETLRREFPETKEGLYDSFTRVD